MICQRLVFWTTESMRSFTFLIWDTILSLLISLEALEFCFTHTTWFSKLLQSYCTSLTSSLKNQTRISPIGVTLTVLRMDFFMNYIKTTSICNEIHIFFSFEIYVILKSWNVSYILIVVFECQTLVFKAVRNLTTAEPDVTQRTIYQLTNLFKICVVWK